MMTIYDKNNTVIPDGFKMTEIGLMPEEWEVVRLGEIVNFQYGYTASGEDKNIGPKFLRITDIVGGSDICWATVPYCFISSEQWVKLHI